MEIECENIKKEEDISVNLDTNKIELLKRRGFYASIDHIDDYSRTIDNLSSSIFRVDGIKWIDIIRKPIEEMEEKLFSKDSVFPQEVCSHYNLKFNDLFAGNHIFYDVEPTCLEPYIARYVRAINRCGMKSNFSCDGWHERYRKSIEIIIFMEDRYSRIWHKLICKKMRLLQWRGDNNGAFLTLPREDDKRIMLYNKINSDAESIENAKDKLKELKRYMIEKCRFVDVDSYTNEEVEAIMGEVIENFIW